jgi:glycosyltransferase involved in cell wall biosynthesis
MSTLSVVLATYNEASNLKRCLDSVAAIADEIIIVDGESLDDTVVIAQKYGAKIITTSNKPIFHINKQMAIDAATSDWILQLDADEVVDEEMSQAIIHLKQKGSTDSAFWLKRKNFFLGRFLTKGGQYPDPVIRLCKRGKARLPQKSVHEQMEVEGTMGMLNGHLLHYNAPTFARYITNANRYTLLTAKELRRQGIKLSFLHDLKYLIIKPKLTFLSLYVRHRGYKDGFPGFVFALFSGLHHALSYMKLGDLYRDKS